ncbi:DHH family phosphoesterase [Candidatus Gracilibacteria bacterium]|nr:DHH family phosphoesterase [Candidatus Gracilibacteria bacterium]
MQTLSGNSINILSPYSTNIYNILLGNRHLDPTTTREFFDPQISDLHDPYMMPDMDKAVARILVAREQKERIVIFGDYDVDGVSSTAILVRFLTEIGCLVSYRLPHRVHDGYGLKAYFFDELASKGVTLVITVDCGTRDIEPIRHAKSLGIDVIVTDHHAVPDQIPEEVIAIVNPKRKDSKYPFPSLAGAGVAFKLLHGVLIGVGSKNIKETLIRYIDFASLGTVADCMPIIGENRVITTLGLRQMQRSESVGLRQFLEGREQIEGNADIIGFHIGPRINAAGRMDTPLTALRWLLAGEGRTDEFFGELEHLNETRKGTTETQYQRALTSVDTSKSILFFDARDLDHGIIGLVAGRLTELYNKPSIVMKNGHDHPLTSRKGDTVAIDTTASVSEGKELSIGSCRAPEWCNLIELLDECKHFFVRYGGHRQAAGFTIETSRIPEFREAMWKAISRVHDTANLPKKILNVECILPISDITVATLEQIDRFRPYGIGNPRPLWIIENVTISNTKPLGQEEKHLSISIAEKTELKLLLWNAADKKPHLRVGNIVSLIVEIDRNEWKGKVSVQGVVRDIIV